MRPSNLMAVEAVSARINAGESLLLAGAEEVLKRLPKGNWIAGTTPYFHDAGGAKETSALIAVDKLPAQALGMRVDVLRPDEIMTLATRAQAHEYIYVIIPGFSPVVEAFAAQQHDIPRLLNQPVIGWVSGARLDQLGTKPAMIFDGRTATAHAGAMAAAYIRLPVAARPRLDVINVFTPSEGPSLRFERDGFEHTHVLVDGKRANLIEAVRNYGHETRWPLVSDYLGAKFNVSFKEIDEAAGVARFYAPLFSAIEYRFAEPLADYRGTLLGETRARMGPTTHHANVCILHHALAQLDGHLLGEFDASMVFGEIAYILHNQTVVYLTV